MRLIGKTTSFVTLFKSLQSIQYLNIESFFLIKTTGLDQGDWLGTIIPLSIMSCVILSITGLKFGFTLLGGCLIGGLSPVFIECVTKVVFPKSLSPLEQTSSNSSSKDFNCFFSIFDKSVFC